MKIKTTEKNENVKLFRRWRNQIKKTMNDIENKEKGNEKKRNKQSKQKIYNLREEYKRMKK